MDQLSHWDPFEGSIAKEKVSVETLTSTMIVATSPLARFMGRLLISMYKQPAGRASSALDLAKKYHWGIRLIDIASQRASSLYALFGIKPVQHIAAVSNELWGEIDDVPFYTVEFRTTDSLEASRAFFLPLPSNPAASFELLPQKPRLFWQAKDCLLYTSPSPRDH
jgi:hypothetical protein